MPLPEGGWLLIQGGVLAGAGTGGGPRAVPDAPRTAVVLQPASRADLLPVLLALYGLTARERQMAELLISGHGTDRIVRTLGISQHTVRDHTKAIFATVNVVSWAELTAVLSAEVSGPVQVGPDHAMGPCPASVGIAG
ncbi:LuxR C-terminal-related transcriptional regulator [Frankia sp. Ag45/Mut15]|uniref:LuxR C-terminal-related transcriptional regulator n=1 Tax=Frankia umida TaxID=573489 RepID=A0ABT0K3Y6_9ACTN|nr:LuxR C-terminal-related transcriptional regulator [Frankia umida]MCK9878232.1 LuxR C-terminal-related transcriptional regulator [Frankia umida]